MAINLDTIETLRAKMKDAPDIANVKRHISKQEAVRELKRDIAAMQKRGYTLDDIAKFFSEGGMPISTPTLKSYLQRTKSDKNKTVRQVEKKAENREENITAAQTKIGRKANIDTDKKQSTPEPKGGFTVRPDSEI